MELTFALALALTLPLALALVLVLLLPTVAVDGWREKMLVVEDGERADAETIGGEAEAVVDELLEEGTIKLA